MLINDYLEQSLLKCWGSTLTRHSYSREKFNETICTREPVKEETDTGLFL